MPPFRRPNARILAPFLLVGGLVAGGGFLASRPAPEPAPVTDTIAVPPGRLDPAGKPTRIGGTSPTTTSPTDTLPIPLTGAIPPGLANSVLSLTFSHEEKAGGIFATPTTAAAVRALIPAWTDHATAMADLGIPVARCVTPGLAKLYSTVPEMRAYYAYAEGHGFSFVGRAHESDSDGNSADAAYWLQVGGATPVAVLGTWTAGTVPTSPLRAVKVDYALEWLVAIGGGAVPGHGADAKTDGIVDFGDGRYGILTGTANNTASLRGGAADAAGKPIRYSMGSGALYIDTTAYNVLALLDAPTTLLSTPSIHVGTATERAPVAIVDDLGKAIGSLGDTRARVTFVSPLGLRERWVAAGGGGLTYEVPQSER